MCLKLLEVGGLLYSQFSLRTALRPLGLGSEPHSKLGLNVLFSAQRNKQPHTAVHNAKPNIIKA